MESLGAVGWNSKVNARFYKQLARLTADLACCVVFKANFNWREVRIADVGES